MARLTSSHDPRGGRGRWHGVSRRRAVRTSQPQSKRHENILSNETLETQVQNDMSPFPAMFHEHVSRRRVPCTQASDMTTGPRGPVRFPVHGGSLVERREQGPPQAYAGHDDGRAL